MSLRIVLKFGGKSLATIEKIHQIKDIIITYVKNGYQPIIVVSAMGNTTDELLALAHSVVPNPPKRELDLLISVGERISMTLLTMALMDSKVDAASFTGSQSGILTTNDFTDARIIDVLPTRLEEALLENRVVVVAGFQGVSAAKEVTTLGRGGSDTTAVALAYALKALKVCYYKDVGGLYNQNPHTDPASKIIPFSSYDEAYKILAHEQRPLLHLRALKLAKKLNVPIEILPVEGAEFEIVGTKIHSNFFNIQNPSFGYETE
ncbi:MAG: aspartate kinase [Chlamydiae bacterium]|nr:aspartate kinase [Chlamydiota bacterium]